MPSTTNLLNKLTARYPKLHFKESDSFHYEPLDHTVFFSLEDAHLPERLLHEVSHAQLNHTDYERDIDLIALERDAWEHAKTVLGPEFDVEVSVNQIDEDMDTYRNWLHARSTCPYCNASGLQTAKYEYTCVVCRQKWRVNEARACMLRRYKLQNKSPL